MAKRAKMAAAKQLSGGAKLAAAGRRPMLLGWLPEHREIIQAAAKADGRSMSQFVYHYGLRAAREILAESGKKA